MIYFVVAGISGPVKIGYAEDVEGRIRQLQAGNPKRLKLLRSCVGGRGAEAWYHHRFSAHRIDREWFHYHPDMLTVAHPPEADEASPGVMKLREFLHRNGLSHQRFAKQIGASAAAVGMWVRGERMPRRPALNKIAEATSGAVTANDFASAA
jgi:hypothetical protein